MGIDPEFMKTIDAARDDSVNLRVGVLNQSIIDTHEYSLEAVLTNVDTREETHLVGEELPGGLGVKYSIPVELVSKRSKYLLDLGDGHVVSVYVTKRSVEHISTNGAQRSRLKKYIDAIAEVSDGADGLYHLCCEINAGTKRYFWDKIEVANNLVGTAIVGTAQVG